MQKAIKVLALVALMAVPWAAGAQLSLPVTMDFESGMGSWTTASTHSSTGLQSSGGHTAAACFRFYYSTNPPQYLISPELSPLTGPAQVEFWYKAQSDYYTESFMLGWSSTTNDPSAFTFGTEVTSNVTSYQKFEGLVPAGTKYVCIKYTANDQYYLYIDDIVIQDPPTCLPISGLTTTASDSANIALSWTDNMNTGASYSVAYWITTDTTWLTTSDTFLTVSNLNASTAYHFLVRAVCSVDDSSAAVGATFRTACGEITLPYSVDFEDAAYNGAWYPCWDSTIHAGTDPSVNDQNSPANHTTGGTYAMYMQGNSSQQYNLVVSPAVPLPGDQIFVSFWARCNSSAWMKAGVITNPRDTSTFIPLVTVSGNSWTEYNFSTTGLNPNATYYIAWLGHRNGFIGKFDDVLIRQDNGCNKPNMAVVDSVGPYDAYLTWTTGGASTTGYDLFYNTSNNLGSATAESVSDAGDTVHYTLTGLLPQTTYHAWVRTACGSDSADAKYIGSFTTDMTCAPVTGLATGNISYTAAQINWSYDSTVGFPTEGVEITIVDNTDTTAEPVVIVTTGNNYTFNDLAAGHSYTVSMRNMCQTVSQTDTAAAVTVTFMTQSCSEITSDGTVNQYIPTYTYYGNTYSQALYLASEVPNVDTINGIAFNVTNTNSGTNSNRVFDIYVRHLDTNSFDGNNYVAVDSSMMYVSNFTFSTASAGWQVIPFDSAFIYNGTSNLLITVNDHTNAWVTAAKFASISAPNRGKYSYRDSNPWTPATMTDGYNSDNIPAIRFVANCEVPQCFAPMLSVESVDSNSITISWVAAGDENEWAVGIGVSNGAITWNSTSVTDTFFTFTNLTANTLYEIHVGSLCNGDTVDAIINVKTSCGAITLPYSTSFEGDTENDAPSCWTVVHSYTYNTWDYTTSSYINVNYPAVSTGSHTGTKSLGFVNASTNPVLIASSALPANNESLMVSFWAQSDAYYGLANLTLEAGLMTNLAVDNSFVPMVTLTGDNDYANYEFATPVLNSDSTYYLAFRYTSDYEYASADVDDIEIRLDDGCHRSSNVIAYGVDTATIDLSWSNDGVVDVYVVKYRQRGTNTWSAPMNPTDTTYTIIGLATATAYEIIVGTICTSDTLWTQAVVAKTTCAPMVLPYSTSFETDTEGDMPACWNNSGATGEDTYYGLTYPCVADGYNTEAHTGTKAITFNYINGTSIVSSEAVTTDGDSIYVSFWGIVENSTYYGTSSIEAGVMTNPAVDSTFIPMVTVTSTSYQRYEFNTSTLNHNTTYYVAFRYTAASLYVTGHIDDILIRHDEGCMYPANLVATPSANDVTLTWNNNSSTANFVIQYHAAGSTTWDTTINTPDTTININGLNPATSYDFRVGFICGTDTLWSNISAVTDCAILPLPYSEDFDAYANDVMPPCWGWNTSFCTHWDGGVFFRNYHGGGSEYAVLPQLDGNIAKYQLEFDCKVGTPAENDGILLGVADAAGTLVGWLDTIQDPNHSRNQHVHHVINMVNYSVPAGAARIAFAQYRSWGEWALIDNINVDQLPDCLPVDTLTVHNIEDPDHTNFTWVSMGEETQWQVYVDTVTAIIDSIPDSLLTTVTTRNYTIPMGDIQGGGIYTFYVRADCGFEHSGWTSYTFGAGTVIMNNSSVADTVVGCGLVVYDNGGPIAGYPAPIESALVIRSENAGSELEVFGGAFGFGSTAATLNIYDGEGTSGTVLYTYNIIDGRDTIDSVLATSTTGALTITFSATGNMAHTGYELYIHCIGTAVCPRPTQVTGEMTGVGEATLHWVGNSASYDVYYKPSGASIWDSQNTTADSLNLTGLIPDTVYDFYVVGICGSETSTPSFVVQLNTTFDVVIEPCDPATNLTYSDVTTTTAILDWTSDGSEWEIEVKHLTVTNVITATTKPYTLTDLLPTMQYNVRVRTKCSGTYVEPYSEWSNTVTFTTLTPDPGSIYDVENNMLTLYPNPASSVVSINVAMEGSVDISIVDMNGRTVYSQNGNDGLFSVDVSTLAKGAYFVRVVGEQATAIRKLIVR